MFFDYQNMTAAPLPNFKGGEGVLQGKIFNDHHGKIAQITLPAGCSIGMHTHDDSYEVIYVLSGSGICIDEGVECPISAGMVNYCPQHHSHSIINTGTEDLCLLGIIPAL